MCPVSVLLATSALVGQTHVGATALLLVLPLDHLLGHNHECIEHVLSSFGGGLDDWDACGLLEVLDLSVGDLVVVLVVALVREHNLHDVVGAVLVCVLHPSVEVVERLVLSHVEDHDDSVGASVVRACQGVVSLLSRGVPLCHELTIWSLTDESSTSSVLNLWGQRLTKSTPMVAV